MNVFLREVIAGRKSTLSWVVSMAGMVAMFMMGMYPAFTADIPAAKELLQGLPEAVRAAFSISIENFFTVFGFYAYFLSFATVAAAIQAMNAGAGVIAKEFSGKTADFLLSKPVTRAHVISAKLAAALVSVVATAVAFGVAGYLAALVATEEPFSAGTFFLLSLTLLLVQLFFMTLGALFAVLIPKIKTVIAVSLPTVFTFYIIGTLGEILGNEEVRWLTPFKFFDPVYIVNNTALERRFLLFEIVLIVLFVAATYVIFAKKNIRASA